MQLPQTRKTRPTVGAHFASSRKVRTDGRTPIVHCPTARRATCESSQSDVDGPDFFPCTDRQPRYLAEGNTLSLRVPSYIRTLVCRSLAGSMHRIQTSVSPWQPDDCYCPMSDSDTLFPKPAVHFLGRRTKRTAWQRNNGQSTMSIHNALPRDLKFRRVSGLKSVRDRKEKEDEEFAQSASPDPEAASGAASSPRPHGSAFQKALPDPFETVYGSKSKIGNRPGDRLSDRPNSEAMIDATQKKRLSHKRKLRKAHQDRQSREKSGR